MNKPKKRRLIHKNAKIVPEGERVCPICKEKMIIERNNGVKVDVCEEHGIWLDKGELKKITRQIHRRMNISQAIAVKHAKLEGKASGTVFGILSFLWD